MKKVINSEMRSYMLNIAILTAIAKEQNIKTRPLKELISFGNKAMPDSMGLFNMSSATDCPSKLLGLCKIPDLCYALSPEKFRPRALPFRRSQELYWLTHSAEEFLNELIPIIKRRRKPTTEFRFSISGDFHSQECVDKCEKIATGLKVYGIITWLITCRDDLDFSGCKNLVVIGSNKMYHHQFIAVKNAKMAAEKAKLRGENAKVCPGDCKSCRLYAMPAGYKIYCEIHGSGRPRKRRSKSLKW